MSTSPRTLFDKIWQAHEVVPETPEAPALLYIDLHLVHEVTSPQAFRELAERGLPVRRPERTVATMDHAIPTRRFESLGALAATDAEAAAQLHHLERACATHGIRLFDFASAERGIVHVMAPELGLVAPGMTVVCGDSHTSTHGAFGAVAFGIGTTEVAHVLATQCLLQRKPKTMRVEISGRLRPGVTAKDLTLAVIAALGVDGGTGLALEYAGEAVESLTMDERMTLANMSIEAGARCGLIAPDEVTFAYLAGCPEGPRGPAWEEALERWRALPSDRGAAYDATLELDVSRLEPRITWGTHPGMSIPIDGEIPHPASLESQAARLAAERALDYMHLAPGRPLLGHPIDVVFLGSCTNARLSDLRTAASLLAGRRISPSVRLLVVPGSQRVKARAEAEGLDRIFQDAGAEWRESGCSMCIAMNGDRLARGHYAVSTSNRNFEGRQGPGGRTFLASPLTAAAAALAGHICDPREWMS